MQAVTIKDKWVVQALATLQQVGHAHVGAFYRKDGDEGAEAMSSGGDIIGDITAARPEQNPRHTLRGAHS